MRAFLTGDGARYDAVSQRLELSRVFKWYGADFAHPHRMPAWIPASKRSIVAAIEEWLDPELADIAGRAAIGFQSYDWTLACNIR